MSQQIFFSFGWGWRVQDCFLFFFKSRSSLVWKKLTEGIMIMAPHNKDQYIQHGHAWRRVFPRRSALETLIEWLNLLNYHWYKKKLNNKETAGRVLWFDNVDWLFEARDSFKERLSTRKSNVHILFGPPKIFLSSPRPSNNIQIPLSEWTKYENA